MPQFKTIDVSKSLKETMGAYHTINAKGQLSYLYKFSLCCLYILQAPFNSFHLWRIRTQLIAQCMWQIGQLTNVLNYLYDNTLKRIYIQQPTPLNIFIYAIDETHPSLWTYAIDETHDNIAISAIDEQLNSVYTIIYVPETVYADDLSQLTADIEQIKLEGINYQIVSL